VVGGSFNDTKRNTFTSQDVRFTTQGDILYAIVLAGPENGSVTIKALGDNSALYQRPIGKVELLSTGKSLHWARNYDGLTVDLPGQTPSSYAFVLRISPEQ
jgi:alpha-L-fucosidase